MVISTQRRRPRPLSEYGKELMEKQKMKSLYNVKERQFKKYVKGILDRRGKVEDAPTLLIHTLERRLDNVVFRLGLALTRAQARQFVSHCHFMLNGKSCNIPSASVKKGDIITIRPKSLKKAIFSNLSETLKKYEPPSWLELDKDKFEGRVVGLPTLEEAQPPSEISAIFEFYSR